MYLNWKMSKFEKKSEMKMILFELRDK